MLMTVETPTRYGVAKPDEMAGLSGLEAMQAMIEGRLPAPPIAKTLGFLLVEVEEGRAVFEGHPTPDLLNPAGTVHGGWALTLVDSATACAAHSLLPPGKAQTTVETKANFTRPILPDGRPIRCEARVVGQGRQIITAEAHITNAEGKIVAHGTSTLMVIDLTKPR